jgi:hypothetical protein
MPVESGIGYCESSGRKEDAYQALLTYHVPITANVMRRWPYSGFCYYLIDCNAGTGIIPDSTKPGSPLVALEVFRRLGLMTANRRLMPPFILHLIERSRHNAGLLKERVDAFRPQMPPDCFCALHVADNAHTVPMVCAQMGSAAHGLLYQDATCVPNWMMLRAANQACPRLDHLVWINPVGIRRSRCHGKPSLLEGMRLSGKQRWLALEPDLESRLRSSFLLGTNAPDSTLKEWRKYRWWDVRGREGRAILEQLK